MAARLWSPRSGKGRSTIGRRMQRLSADGGGWPESLGQISGSLPAFAANVVVPAGPADYWCQEVIAWSGRPDLNRRPPAPKLAIPPFARRHLMVRARHCTRDNRGVSRNSATTGQQVTAGQNRGSSGHHCGHSCGRAWRHGKSNKWPSGAPAAADAAAAIAPGSPRRPRRRLGGRAGKPRALAPRRDARNPQGDP